MPEVVGQAAMTRTDRGTTGGATAAARPAPTSPPAPATDLPAGSRLDRWVDAYASRTRGMTASEIRALFAVASRPEVVSLAGGMPHLSALPLDIVGDALAQLVAERGLVALQYGSGQGDPGLRERIPDVMAPQAVEIGRAHV